VEYLEKKGSACAVWVRKPEGKTQTGRPRLHGNCFKIDLKARGWGSLE
jgi:hypothetical protein